MLDSNTHTTQTSREVFKRQLGRTLNSEKKREDIPEPLSTVLSIIGIVHVFLELSYTLDITAYKEASVAWHSGSPKCYP